VATSISRNTFLISFELIIVIHEYSGSPFLKYYFLDLDQDLDLDQHLDLDLDFQQDLFFLIIFFLFPSVLVNAASQQYFIFLIH